MLHAWLAAKRRRLEALLLCRFYLLVRVAAPVLRPHEFNVIVFLTPRLSVSISRVFSALSVQFALRGGSSHRASMLERGDGHIHGHTCGEPEQVLKHCVRALGTTRLTTTATATDRRASGHCSVCGHCRAAMRGTFGKAEVARGSSCLWLLPLLALLRARCLPPRIRSIIVLRLPDRIA